MSQEHFRRRTHTHLRAQRHLTLVRSEAESPRDVRSGTTAFDGDLGRPGYPAAQPGASRAPGLKPDLDDPVVIKVLVGKLYRELRGLPELDRRVMCLLSGIGCRPHSHREAAKVTGLTERTVRLSLDRSMRSLRAGFGVELADAA